MINKLIIIITGGPGTGKSFMAARLSDYFKEIVTLPYDKIKELNFDRFGFDNKEQKDELNRFSLEEFYLSLRKEMRLSHDLLIEYPFYQPHKQRLAGLITEYGYTACTVYLHGDPRVIYERGIRRDRDGRRHPGHLMNQYHKEDYSPEALGFDAVPSCREYCRMLEDKDYNLMLGKVITVDVTDASAVPFEEVAAQISALCTRDADSNLPQKPARSDREGRLYCS